MGLSIIAAIGKNGEIGLHDSLPWDIPEDRRFFRATTDNKTVIMGRKTFESIVSAIGKPLPNRRNIILTKDVSFMAPEGCLVVHSLEDVMRTIPQDGETFIIGGSQIYKTAMPLVDRMYITQIDKEFEADAYFPKIDPAEWKVVQDSGRRSSEREPISFSFLVYERI